MGLTNFLKKKLESHPPRQTATKIYETTKKGASTAYHTGQKIVNSPHLNTIGRAAQGVSIGIDKGAATFNNSIGANDFAPTFGNNDLFNLKMEPNNNDLFNLEIGHESKTHERREHHRHHKQEHRQPRKTRIIEHYY